MGLSSVGWKGRGKKKDPGLKRNGRGLGMKKGRRKKKRRRRRR